MNVITQIRIDAIDKQLARKAKYIDYLRTQMQLTRRDVTRLTERKVELIDQDREREREFAAKQTARELGEQP